jgi:nucleoside phosphorylase
MTREKLDCDVFIECALPEEAEAILQVISHRHHVSFQQGFSTKDLYEYQYAIIRNKENEPLTILVSWLPSKGLLETGLHLKPFLEEFRPRFAAMVGICAGDKTKVELGDIVVAEYAFIYDGGKVIVDEKDNGRKKYLSEGRTENAKQRIIQYAHRFRHWERALENLTRPAGKQLPPTVHIAPMASGNAVRSDSPFQEAWFPASQTVAIDMEGAAFYRTVNEFLGCPALLVKGVCDYADKDKDDTYHKYAALAAATYLLCFIDEYVTEKTMPRRDEQQPQKIVQKRVLAPLGLVTNSLRNPQRKQNISRHRRAIFVGAMLICAMALGLSSSSIFPVGLPSRVAQLANLEVAPFAEQSSALVLSTTIPAQRFDDPKSLTPYEITVQVYNPNLQSDVHIYILNISLILDQVTPIPHPLKVSIPGKGDGVSYPGNYYRAVYQGQQPHEILGTISLPQQPTAASLAVPPSFLGPRSRVELRPNEHDRINIALYSYLPIYFQFHLQMTYYVGKEEKARISSFSSPYEVVFSNASNWHTS